MNTLTAQQFSQLQLLADMDNDTYFPPQLVDRIREILWDVCRKIESTGPQSEEELYVITHAATEQINKLQEKFEQAGSEIETMARDAIAVSFGKVAHAYGFAVDLEALVATREW